MKYKTIAIIGVISFVLGVLSSATDNNGNFLAPVALIVVSGITTVIFTIMATIRLWKSDRLVSVAFLSSTIIFSVLQVIQEVTSPEYGSPFILILNITKVINFLLFWYVVFLLWAIGKHEK